MKNRIENKLLIYILLICFSGLFANALNVIIDHKVYVKYSFNLSLNESMGTYSIQIKYN